MQDQLYKDYIRVEKNFKKKEQDLTARIRTLEDDCQAEREKANKTE